MVHVGVAIFNLRAACVLLAAQLGQYCMHHMHYDGQKTGRGAMPFGASAEKASSMHACVQHTCANVSYTTPPGLFYVNDLEPTSQNYKGLAVWTSLQAIAPD